MYPHNTIINAHHGLVGIGTNAPQKKLHIETFGIGSAAFSGAFLIRRPTSTVPEFFISSNGRVGIGTAGPGGQLHVKGNTILDGKVGIGTTNPQQMLEVDGGNTPFGTLARIGNNNGRLDVGFNGANEIIDAANKLLINYHSGREVHIGTGATKADVHLGKNLFVCNTLYAQEWVVEVPWWCDFALKPDYKKMYWRDKRNYYWTFGYLPYMDSGAEIEKNGFRSHNLKGMMLNIEENRLDIDELMEWKEAAQEIMKEQQRDIDELKKRNEELGKRIEGLEKKAGTNK